MATGIVLLLWMGLQPEMWSKLYLIVPVYILRTAIINSSYPLRKSIMMDFVPKVTLLPPLHGPQSALVHQCIRCEPLPGRQSFFSHTWATAVRSTRLLNS